MGTNACRTLGKVIYAFLAVLFCSLLQAQQQGRDLKLTKDPLAQVNRGRLWAVVIGISQYANVPPQAQLKFADRDAQAFSTFLRSPNGGGFPPNHVQVLLNNKASLSAVRTVLGTWLARSAEPQDVVYIFFAGHGVMEGAHDGYLLAHDSDPQNLYATALPLSELDKIITQRVRAKNVVLIADACHAGNLGWASRGAPEQALISRYLTEVGAGGQGVLRLLASRADERSYEDAQWGGGHGAFTYFLLQGLQGHADRDSDGVVRAAELIDYLSSIVPDQTKALQHPQAAGHIDPAMALAVTGSRATASAAPITVASGTAASVLEVHGPAGTEIYVNNRFYGRVRPSGVLVIDQLQPGTHEVSFDAGAATTTQAVSLTGARTVLNLTAPPEASPLAGTIVQAIGAGNILEPGGAWELYQRLLGENPREPQRVSIEAALSTALEEVGQRAINDYVHAPITDLRRDTFHRAARAFAALTALRPGESQLQAKELFFVGRALVVDGKYTQAAATLERAAAADPRAAHVQNALGVAYERLNRNQDALRAFQAAARLAPAWALPHLHLALQYQAQRTPAAEQEFKTAVQLDPRQPLLRVALASFYGVQQRYADAERELSKVVETSPNYASAYRELGQVLEATRQYGRAADSLENYLRLAPAAADSADVRGRIAKNRAQAGRKPPTLLR